MSCMPFRASKSLLECRNLIASGAIGKILDVVAAYSQDWMILGLNSEEDNFTKWIGAPAKSGNSNVTAAMGVHLYYLVKAMTGLTLEQVLADFSYYPPSASPFLLPQKFLKFLKKPLDFSPDPSYNNKADCGEQ